MFYAGIGSRETPFSILKEMQDIAWDLSHKGHTLRSGHAPGADQAFEKGAQGNAEIFLPWASFERQVPIQGRAVVVGDRIDLHEFVLRFHPRPSSLSDAGHKLMRRNACQILGERLNSSVSFVLCWTKDGRASGGTGQALRIAEHYKIPIFNLFDITAANRVWRFIHGVP